MLVHKVAITLLGLLLPSLAEIVDFKMQANWNKTPFKLNVLETFSAYNESLYLPLTLKLLGVEVYEDGIELTELSLTDEEYYNFASSLVESDDLFFVKTDLALRTHSPRIQAHLQTSRPENCGRACSIQGSNTYHHPDDVFALKTAKDDPKDLLAFDRLIGHSSNVFVLYGDYSSNDFRQFFANFLGEAESGKLAFVWRYIVPEVEEKETLAGYAIDLTLKRTDYIVIDDRGFTPEQKAKLAIENKQKPLAIDTGLLDPHLEDIPRMTKEDLEGLSKKLIKYVQDKDGGIELLRKLVLDLPKYAPSIALQQEPDSDFTTTSFPEGIYIDGALVSDKFPGVFDVLRKLKKEKQLIDGLGSIGVSKQEAQNLIYQFSNHSIHAVQRLPRYNTLGSEAIIYFNNPAKDFAYRYHGDAREHYSVYDGGHIPAAAENIHDTAFVINPTDPLQLYCLLTMSNSILRNLFSQRIGIVPLINSPEDRIVTEQLLQINHDKGPIEALRYLFTVNEILNSPEREFEEVIQVEPTHKEELLEILDEFKKQYSLDEQPYLIVNGVFYEFDQKWQYLVSNQVLNDVQFLQKEHRQGRIPEDIKFEDFLRKDSIKKRDPFLIPESFTDVQSAYIAAPSLGTFRELQKLAPGDGIVFNIIGQLSCSKFREQVKEAFKSGTSTRIIDVTSKNNTATLNGFSTVEELSSFLDNQFAVQPIDQELSSLVLKSFGLKSVDDVYVVLNGRMLDLDQHSIITSDQLKLVLKREQDLRFSAIETRDDYEYLSWVITSSFYENEGNIVVSPVLPRYPIGSSGFVFESGDGYIDVDLVMDPASEHAQQLLGLSALLEKFSFVRVRVWYKPSDAEDTIKRLYQGVYPSEVVFDTEGNEVRNYSVVFDNIPEKTLFTADVDVVPSWVVSIREANADLDNIKVDLSGSVHGVYELTSILVQGHARLDTQSIPPVGLALELVDQNGKTRTDTNVMANLGYFQLKANPGIWTLQPQESPELEYDLVSIDTEFKAKVSDAKLDPIPIFDLSGTTIYPIMTKKAVSTSLFSSLSKSLKSFFKPKYADINIFTVASGHLYERFLGIMTASVMAHTKHTVKFWLIENYMSPKLKQHLPLLAKHYGFEYEFITYKWPTWLRGQREKQRTIWGYKILFLDVLFPQTLDKVIFVDSDQIVRTDMKELVDIDLQGSVYGFTPMCDSRKEMEGFRFWKQGYWQTLLGDTLKYHISALYVVDLKKFREIAAGDRLRQHYQSLSADPNSLSNLDQDLPNNLQHTISIHSLPQEWLWCETWCDDESLKKAKTIDLCNNPLTKEPKLDRARRQIPEWTTYDQEIENLLKGGIIHDEL